YRVGPLGDHVQWVTLVHNRSGRVVFHVVVAGCRRQSELRPRTSNEREVHTGARGFPTVAGKRVGNLAVDSHNLNVVPVIVVDRRIQQQVLFQPILLGSQGVGPELLWPKSGRDGSAGLRVETTTSEALGHIDIDESVRGSLV